MESRFRLKLSIIMILFAVIMSTTIASIDHLRTINQVKENNEMQIVQIEDIVQYIVRNTEKAHYLFEDDLSVKMQSSTEYLMDLYENDPTFAYWDFQALKEMLNVDIYMINDQNQIEYSSYEADIGLDFSKCCKKLSSILDERRISGEYFEDGIDIEQTTGRLMKYSYMATRDKKYLIQLGYSFEESQILKEFNFLKVINEFAQSYPSINQINILNIGGYALGKPVERGNFSVVRRAAFERTLATRETSEVKEDWMGQPAVYRYVHYSSDYDTGITKNKVVEIIYNEHELQSTLNENFKSFLIQLSIVLIVMVAISLIISRWVSKPMYLAFHDSLTGLKNRASLEDIAVSVLNIRKEQTALMMIDIDNFKLVNDNYGHDIGDRQLKSIAHLIKSVIREGDHAFRLGGDEFTILMPSAMKDEAEEVAKKIILAMEASDSTKLTVKGEKITVSIGISMAPDHGQDLKTLLKKADLAMYASKEKGKNQYQFFDEKS